MADVSELTLSVLYSALRVDGTSYDTVCELYNRV